MYYNTQCTKVTAIQVVIKRDHSRFVNSSWLMSGIKVISGRSAHSNWLAVATCYHDDLLRILLSYM